MDDEWRFRCGVVLIAAGIAANAVVFGLLCGEWVGWAIVGGAAFGFAAACLCSVGRDD